MQEEHPLPDSPEWRASELVGAGGTLNDVIREPCAHVVYEQVGEQVYRAIFQYGAVLHALLREKLAPDQFERLLAENAKLTEDEACRLALED